MLNGLCVLFYILVHFDVRIMTLYQIKVKEMPPYMLEYWCHMQQILKFSCEALIFIDYVIIVNIYYIELVPKCMESFQLRLSNVKSAMSYRCKIGHCIKS